MKVELTYEEVLLLRQACWLSMDDETLCTRKKKYETLADYFTICIDSCKKRLKYPCKTCYFSEVCGGRDKETCKAYKEGGY